MHFHHIASLHQYILLDNLLRGDIRVNIYFCVAVHVPRRLHREPRHHPQRNRQVQQLLPAQPLHVDEQHACRREHKHVAPRSEAVLHVLVRDEHRHFRAEVLLGGVRVHLDGVFGDVGEEGRHGDGVGGGGRRAEVVEVVGGVVVAAEHHRGEEFLDHDDVGLALAEVELNFLEVPQVARVDFELGIAVPVAGRLGGERDDPRVFYAGELDPFPRNPFDVNRQDAEVRKCRRVAPSFECHNDILVIQEHLLLTVQ
mmetsp:Transcript_11774/g.29769  ORF Transcript_11774/g.29769 Transcript_11774/m.29769 type:complete len:255 (-) Transcript_11774:989-1753(-)